MNGNIWKFTLDQPAQKLFTAKSAQDKKQVVSAAPCPELIPVQVNSGYSLVQVNIYRNSI